MNPRYSEQAEQFRARVREFLSANLPPDWKGIGVSQIQRNILAERVLGLPRD